MPLPTEHGLKARLIRGAGFFRKEIFSVYRQPRLLLTLVIGPFLILLIFGLGYRDTPPPFRTLLVLGNEDAQLAADREDLGGAFGDSIVLEGTTTDAAVARDRLGDGEVDLLIIAPDDPLRSLDAGERADFQVIHGEVDPILRSSIDLLARLSVDEINRRVLAGVVTTAQEEAEEVDEPLIAVRESSSQLVSSLEAGNRSKAESEIASLRQELAVAESQTEGADSLYSSVARALGTTDEQVFTHLRETLETAESEDSDAALEGARELEATLEQLEAQVTRARDLDPDLLVSPFGVRVMQLNDVPRAPGIFYSPGTLALLVQHLALTFAALSLVRERELGLTEVFRVSPLGTTETLAGKYLGFGAIALVVSAALTGAMLLFGVRIRGSMLMYVLVVLLLIVASLGLGFLLSGASKTDSQAVQYSMIALLLSIFFTGFVLPLDQLAAPVQAVSYLIPATYGIRAFHDIFFRGASPDPLVLGGLALYAVALAAGAWWVVKREVASVKT